MVIEIPLSERGKKNAGKYVAMIDNCDKTLARKIWTCHCIINSDKTYANRVFKGSRIHLHRAVMERILKRPLTDDEYVDHIDGNGLNNTRKNLRLATKSQNAMNRRVQKTNQTGYKGVGWAKNMNKYHARICIDGKLKRLGFFDTPEEAHEAYCNAAKEAFGEFWNDGFI